MGDTWRWNNLFAKTTRSWAIDTHHELCVRWDNCAHTTVLKQTHHELERQTCPSQVEGQTFPSNLKQNKGTGNGIRSLCSRTRWESQIQIPTRSVHQTFRASSHESSSPLCFPHFDSPDSQSHVFGRACLFTPPVGYSGSLSTANETCNKDKGHCTKKILSVHIFQVPRSLKSGVHLFAALEHSFIRRVGVFQCRSSNFASATGFPMLVPPLLLNILWSILLQRKFELIVRVSLHDGGLPRWFGLCTGT